LLSHDNGRTFKTIITSLAELGYAVEWQVLNAKNFGVPQNRERVFIIGHLGGFGGRQVFPIGESEKNITEPNRKNTSVHTPPITCQGGMNCRGMFISKTIRSGGRKSPHGSKQNWDSYEVDGKIRRLTPTECERLMGLPDGWTAEGTEGKISDSQRYKLCGNGVVVNVVQAIIERLI
jgi:DNA (cytosine-5)-methyltransferase 1